MATAIDMWPLSQPPLPGAYFVSDRWQAVAATAIHNGSCLRETGTISNTGTGNPNAIEVAECNTAGQRTIGINYNMITAAGNLAAADVNQLFREVAVITHGPAKVLNGGTGIIMPWQEVTPAGTVTIGGIQYLGTVMARVNPRTQSKLGVSMEYFARQGATGAIWVDPGWRAEHPA